MALNGLRLHQRGRGVTGKSPNAAAKGRWNKPGRARAVAGAPTVVWNGGVREEEESQGRGSSGARRLREDGWAEECPG